MNHQREGEIIIKYEISINKHLNAKLKLLLTLWSMELPERRHQNHPFESSQIGNSPRTQQMVHHIFEIVSRCVIGLIC